MSLANIPALLVLLATASNATRAGRELLTKIICQPIEFAELYANGTTHMKNSKCIKFTDLSITELPFGLLSEMPALESIISRKCVSDQNNPEPSINIITSGHPLPQLKEFCWQSTSITDLPENAFGKAGNLSKIILANNNISQIAVGAFNNLSKLSFLDLTNNSITILETGIFWGLWALKNLQLGENKIKEIGQDVFKNNGKLEILIVRKNNLTALRTTTLEGATNLKSLDLSNNQISVIEEKTFCKLDNLAVLILSHNKLESLESKSFCDLKSINRVHLEFNNLLHFNIDSQAIYSVEHLFLSNNPNMQLDEQSFDMYTPNLRCLKLNAVNLIVHF